MIPEITASMRSYGDCIVNSYVIFTLPIYLLRFATSLAFKLGTFQRELF